MPVSHQSSCLGGGVDLALFQGHHEYLNGKHEKDIYLVTRWRCFHGQLIVVHGPLAPQFVLDINENLLLSLS